MVFTQRLQQKAGWLRSRELGRVNVITGGGGGKSRYSKDIYIGVRDLWDVALFFH